MKTSLSNLFAVASLACVLSTPALAAAPDGDTPMPHTETAPAGNALPPGTMVPGAGPGDPSMGNGMDANGSSVRPKTSVTPDIHEREQKDPDARKKLEREQVPEGSGAPRQ